MENEPTQSHVNPKLQRVFGVILVLVITALVLAAKYFHLQELFKNALLWIDHWGAWGVGIFILLYILASVLFISGTILTLGAGVVFGVILGSIYVFIGATLGATAAFLVGRYCLRGWVSKQIGDNPKFQAVDKAVAQEGFKIVLLMRLSPVFPFIFLNYAFSITQVSLKDYLLGSIGMIPGTILYVYLGSLFGNFALIGVENQPADPTVQGIIRLLGFIATVVVSIYITQIAQKALKDVSEGEIKDV